MLPLHSRQIGHSLRIDLVIIGKRKLHQEIKAMNEKLRITSLTTVLDIEIAAKLVNISKKLTMNKLVVIFHLNISSREFYLLRIHLD